MHRIETELFQLEFSAKNYSPDARESENAVLDLRIFSDDFGAVASWTMDLSQFAAFAKALSAMSENGSGCAELRDSHNGDNYIHFECADHGMVKVSGKIANTGNSGFTQCLSFENQFDAKRLPVLAAQLSEDYQGFSTDGHLI